MAKMRYRVSYADLQKLRSEIVDRKKINDSWLLRYAQICRMELILGLNPGQEIFVPENATIYYPFDKAVYDVFRTGM